MRRSDLGEFEELVLLTIATQFPEAYSVIVAEKLEEVLKRTITTGATHAAMQRLEKKGFLESKMGESTAERGGRRKRLYTVTPAGGKILREVREVRENLWGAVAKGAIPELTTASK